MAGSHDEKRGLFWSLAELGRGDRRRRSWSAGSSRWSSGRRRRGSSSAASPSWSCSGLLEPAARSARRRRGAAPAGERRAGACRTPRRGAGGGSGGAGGGSGACAGGAARRPRRVRSASGCARRRGPRARRRGRRWATWRRRPALPARPAALAAPLEGGPDDLKRIKGVGPKLEEMLHAHGIYHSARSPPGGRARSPGSRRTSKASAGGWCATTGSGRRRSSRPAARPSISQRVDRGEFDA